MCEDWARADIGLQKRGQILGFIIAVVGVGGGLYVAATGAPAAGAAVSSFSLAAIVAAFLRQRQLGQAEPDADKPEKPAKKG
jgi:D-tyrosyl-tRNA(Tyr) deacylase